MLLMINAQLIFRDTWENAYLRHETGRRICKTEVENNCLLFSDVV